MRQRTGIRGPVTVVVGCVDELIGPGLNHTLSGDPRVHVLSTDLDDADLEHVVTQEMPRVAILGERVQPSVVAHLRTTRPAPGVLVLAHDPPPLYEPALRALGVNCLARSASRAEVLAAVHRAADRDSECAVNTDPLPGPGDPYDGMLTTKEIEVMRLLVLGRCYAEIGGALRIAPETARKHTGSICRKLGKTRLELVGMLSPAPPG